MATVPSRDPTGAHREDSEISRTKFLQGAAILEFINFEMEMEIVSESDLRGSFIVSEKSALVCVCVCVCVFLLKFFPSSLGTFFCFRSLALSLSLSQFLRPWSYRICPDCAFFAEFPHQNSRILLPLIVGIWSSTWRYYCIYCRDYGKHGCCSCLQVAERGRHRNECCALERSAPQEQCYGQGSAAENWEENSGLGCDIFN